MSFATHAYYAHFLIGFEALMILLPKSFPLQKLLHSAARGFTLPAVGVTSAFRRSQDTLILSRH
jgi:hypothetical protein